MQTNKTAFFLLSIQNSVSKNIHSLPRNFQLAAHVEFVSFFFFLIIYPILLLYPNWTWLSSILIEVAFNFHLIIIYYKYKCILLEEKLGGEERAAIRMSPGGIGRSGYICSGDRDIMTQTTTYIHYNISWCVVDKVNLTYCIRLS